MFYMWSGVLGFYCNFSSKLCLHLLHESRKPAGDQMFCRADKLWCRVLNGIISMLFANIEMHHLISMCGFVLVKVMAKLSNKSSGSKPMTRMRVSLME